MLFHPGFTSHCKKAAALQELVPANITNDTSISGIQEAIDYYHDNLLNADLIVEGFCHWISSTISSSRTSARKAD